MRRRSLYNALFPRSLTTKFGILEHSDLLNSNTAILHIAAYTGHRSALHNSGDAVLHLLLPLVWILSAV
jgi:hypothetical protein